MIWDYWIKKFANLSREVKNHWKKSFYITCKWKGLIFRAKNESTILAISGAKIQTF